MFRPETGRNQQWQWRTGEEDAYGIPLAHFRRVFYRLATNWTILFTFVVTILVIGIRLGILWKNSHWYVTELDMWSMIVITLTWAPLILGLRYFSRFLPMTAVGVAVVLYWSLAITLSNTPANLAGGAVVVYYAIVIIASSFLLPSWSCLALAVVYGAVMLVCAWITQTQIRLFDIAGLALAGLFSWFAGNALEASYRSLHDLNSSLRQSNQSLSEENRQRAILESELRIAMETAEKANRLKSQFLANVSHEIRTPLTSLIGFTHLLQKTPLEHQQREYLETIRRSGDLLLTLLNDILDFSKIESRQLKLENINFDLKDVLNSLHELIHEQLQKKPVTFRVEYPDALPRRFQGDPTRLRQIFLNLVGNAVKFTPQGEVTVRAEEEGLQTGGEVPVYKMRMTVRDTGIGIPRDRQADIFKAFVQGDGSTTRKYGGTGLGLTITQELVEHMGGTISLESEVGKGSAFIVRLALPESRRTVEEPADATQDSAAAGREISEGGLQAISVLVAEDNENNRYLVSALLQNMGCRVETVQNGLEAVAMAKIRKFDILLLDVQMPEMDGLEAAREIRKTPGQNVPIIAMTAHGSQGMDYLKAGMNDCLIKPVDVKLLRRKILEWIRA